jgi:hypothetical protein
MGKYLEGSGVVLIEILSRYFPGATEENQYILRASRFPVDI